VTRILSQEEAWSAFKTLGLSCYDNGNVSVIRFSCSLTCNPINLSGCKISHKNRSSTGLFRNSWHILVEESWCERFARHVSGHADFSHLSESARAYWWDLRINDTRKLRISCVLISIGCHNCKHMDRKWFYMRMKSTKFLRNRR